MALDRSARPLAQCLRCTRHERIALPIRSFSTSVNLQDAETAQAEKPARALDPLTVSTPRLERKMMREQKQMPIGSRRRRRAIASSANIPFEQLPYQCFQEARAFLQEDRAEKLDMIKKFRNRIEKLMDTVPVTEAEIEKKEARLRDMRKRLEDTKILADINDPMVKKKFEDGLGDMNKPIYRHLAQKKWRSYERELLMQRITQMNVIPDVLDEIDPTVSVDLSFSSPANPLKSRKVQHGELVDSRVSEHAPNLNIQPFEKGEKLVTIAVVNPDVPNVEKDAFDYRCHFLACNVPISATQTHVELGKLSEENQVVIPWLPAYSQSGLPYQRMAIFVLEQPPASAVSPGSEEVPPSKALDVADVKSTNQKAFSRREDFILRDLRNTFDLKPVGVDLFRTVWDDGTAGVMQRAGIVGWDVEFKRKRVEPLPYKRLKEERFR
ncbi:54S ribosomal protein L35, mitochondrial [Pseudocercospora fuligena]|uniref:Large ribosomal subunit protein mL38 n=1 Tax=Pseudocercospora fuligena TaxID=685502 RepID=A0A8H6RL84_9PEZI|nr:54S ribosomal protein L35, mitochondrial [Pseudocercospora fuligena]